MCYNVRKMSDKSANEVLELYKLHIELADRVSQRREAANRLFAGLLVAVVTAFFLMFRFGIVEAEIKKSGSKSAESSVVASEVAPSDGQVSGSAPGENESSETAPSNKKTTRNRGALILSILLMVCGGGMGLCLCFAWMSVIHLYCDKSIKISQTLNALGSQISSSGIIWGDIISEGHSYGHHEITRAEKIVPGAFMFIFVIMLLFGVIGGGYTAYKEGFLTGLLLLLVLAGFITNGIKGGLPENTR